jgi:hypothetical protein
VIRQENDMPAKTAKQARFMRGCEHNPKAMHGKCPSKKVAKEFNHTAKKPKK